MPEVVYLPNRKDDRVKLSSGAYLIALTAFGFPTPPHRKPPDDPFAFLKRPPKKGPRNWTLYCPFCKRRYPKDKGILHETLTGGVIRLCPNCALNPGSVKLDGKNLGLSRLEEDAPDLP